MNTGGDDLEQVAGVVEGEVLIGKYRVERLLGVGGMGVVVAAHHLQLDTSVAIKILLRDMLGNAEAVARFSREARAAIQMNSEHVARVFDVGTLPTGAPYMVMELLEGIDLRLLLEQQGPVAVEEAVDFVLQASEAVAEAHELGIVHRDLKPANLFCIRRPDGRRVIKVLDFGISKVTGPMWTELDESLTVAAAVMGTPSYMSPEQLEAPQTIDARTDIWTLGVILYELLTGRAPFEGSTLPQVSVRIAVRAPLPIETLTPNIPAGLAQVIDTCLEKDRTRRYQTVAELATALLPFGSRRARASVNRIVENIEPPAAAEASPRAAPLRRRQAVIAAVAVGAVALVFAVLVSSAFRGGAGSSNQREARAGGPGSPASRPIDIQPLPAGASNLAGVRLASALRPLPPLVPHVMDGALARNDEAGVSSRHRAVAEEPRHRSRTAARRISPGLTARPSGATERSPGADRCDPPFELDEQGRKHFKPECWGGAAAGVTQAPSAASCNPNYELDDQGRKHFKPECFLKSNP